MCTNHIHIGSWLNDDMTKSYVCWFDFTISKTSSDNSANNTSHAFHIFFLYVFFSLTNAIFNHKNRISSSNSIPLVCLVLSEVYIQEIKN